MEEINSFKQELGLRIRFLRTSKNTKMTQDELADNLHSVSRANLSRIEKGEIVASALFIKEVSAFFRVSADWLLTGQEFNSLSTQNPDLERLIEAFNRLDDNNRHALKTYAAFLLSSDNPDLLGQALNKPSAPTPAPEPDTAKEEKSVYLPILGTAAAGTPIMAEELLEGFLPVPATKIKKNAYLIRAKGDSMIEAGINNGDMVIINPQPMVENGEIALVKVDGEVTIKKFHRYDFEVRLKPANSFMKDIVVSDLAKLRILGKVIGVVPAEKAEQNIRYEFDGPNG